MRMFKSMFLVVAVAIAAIGSAQVTEPAAEVKALDWMVGEWAGKVKWTMMGMNEEGPMTWKVEKDGLFIKQSSTIEMMGMKMTEVGYTGWDEKKKKYWSNTFTNFAGVPRYEWGEKKGDAMVFISDPWDVPSPTGGPSISRSTMTKKGDDVHFVLEFKNGDKWDKVGEGIFKKKK